MGVGGKRHAPATLPRERPGTHRVGGWVGPRAGLDRVRKISPPPGFDPWNVQPVASCYTDYTILAHTVTRERYWNIMGRYIQQQSFTQHWTYCEKEMGYDSEAWVYL